MPDHIAIALLAVCTVGTAYVWLAIALAVRDLVRGAL